MKLAIFGGTGGTGRQLVDQSLARGHDVTVLARHPQAVRARAGVTVVAGDARDRSAVARTIAGRDAVLCALGGRPWRRAENVCSTAMPAIIAGMQAHGVRRVIAMSTFGAGDTRRQVPLPARLVVFGCILASEVADKEAMEAQLAATDLDWTIVRVGVLKDTAGTAYRASDDGSIRGMGRIGRADVARFMLDELVAKAWVRRRPVVME